ncbi:trigger factor [Filimonas effusa]|uniref:Trigger factor n=1 Tax=Filimonas effusa TaxID=2508721 RepID=A0A4Q1D4K2_9BACT|nr:trigger factor [Filimonas effusa]RXK83339.1 trigger factor [Filimonas effusa]
MAIVTRENIGLLTDKLTVTVAREDYYPAFEQSLKKYAKTANIPGFRKGMVPASLVKKMHGQGVFTEEVLRRVEKELGDYMAKEQLDIFAQPLPMENDARAFDMNNPADYVFAFEIGLKPDFALNTGDIAVTRYKVNVTEDMINDEVERLRTRHGKMTDPEAAETDEHVLTVQFDETDAAGNVIEGGISKSNSLLVKYFAESIRPTLIGLKKDATLQIQLATAFDSKEREWVMSDLGLNKDSDADADKYFRLTITKVGLIEKAELAEEFFETVYPGRGVKTEEEFRNTVKSEIEAYYGQQSSNQVHDQIYHHLVDHTNMEFPAEFLKRWLQTGGEKPKTAEEAEAEYPSFANQLKWTLISSKLINDNKITVEPAEIKEHAKQQMLGYMGGQSLDSAPWLDEYTNRMMQDQKFVENAYFQLQTTKLFQLLEGQVKAKEESISAEDFASKLHHHHH